MKCKNCDKEIPQRAENSPTPEETTPNYLIEADENEWMFLTAAINNIEKEEVVTASGIEEQNFVAKLLSKIYCLRCKNLIKNKVITQHFWSLENKKNLMTNEGMEYTLAELGIRYNNGILRFKPDLILHHSHNEQHTNLEQQKLIFEIKTKQYSRKTFFKDFFKLNVYIDKLNFQQAVFLSIGKPVEKIETLIKSYIDKGYYISNEYKRIYFVICPDAENFKKDIAVYTLNKNLSTN